MTSRSCAGSSRRLQAAGGGPLVTVVGEAGVGKSRLLREFTAGLGGEAVVVRGRCLPYGEGITFWPIAEAVRAAAGHRRGRPARARAGQGRRARRRRRRGGRPRRVGDRARADGVRRRGDVLGRAPAVRDPGRRAPARRRDRRPALGGADAARPGRARRRARAPPVPRWSARRAPRCSTAPTCLPPATVGRGSRSSACPPPPRRRWPSGLLGRPRRRCRDDRAHRHGVRRQPALRRADGGHARRRAPRGPSSRCRRRSWRCSPRASTASPSRSAPCSSRQRWPAWCSRRRRSSSSSPTAEREHVPERLAAVERRRFIRSHTAVMGDADGYQFEHILVRDAVYRRLLKRTRAQMHERFVELGRPRERRPRPGVRRDHRLPPRAGAPLPGRARAARRPRPRARQARGRAAGRRRPAGVRARRHARRVRPPAAVGRPDAGARPRPARPAARPRRGAHGRRRVRPGRERPARRDRLGGRDRRPPPAGRGRHRPAPAAPLRR